MPTYEYECTACRRVFEVRQRISEPPLTSCDACGGSVRRLISPAPFILKGDGWYVTDYPSEARKKGMEADKPAATKPSTSEKSGESGSSASTSTPAASSASSSSTSSG